MTRQIHIKKDTSMLKGIIVISTDAISVLYLGKTKVPTVAFLIGTRFVYRNRIKWPSKARLQNRISIYLFIRNFIYSFIQVRVKDTSKLYHVGKLSSSFGNGYFGYAMNIVLTILEFYRSV